MKNARILTMTNEEYHADTTAVSSSGIKKLSDSAFHYWAAYLDPNRVKSAPTPAMELGTLIHALVLEPDTVKTLIPKLSTKAQKDLDVAQSVSKAIKENENALPINMGIGFAEQTIFWEEDIEIEPGVFVTVGCKIRPDYRVDPGIYFADGLITDVKSCSDAGPVQFEKDAYNLGYYIQDAFYARGVQALTGMSPKFIFLAGEKSAPFATAAYSYTEEDREIAWAECVRCLKLYAIARKTGVWTGYGKGVNQIKIPNYAKEKKYVY